MATEMTAAAVIEWLRANDDDSGNFTEMASDISKELEHRAKPKPPYQRPADEFRVIVEYINATKTRPDCKRVILLQNDTTISELQGSHCWSVTDIVDIDARENVSGVMERIFAKVDDQL